MWNRKEVKARGKAAFKRNFWLCVLVSIAIILPTLVSGSVSVKAIRQGFNLEDFVNQISNMVENDPDLNSLIERINNMSEEEFAQFCVQNDIYTQEDFDAWIELQVMSLSGREGLAQAMLDAFGSAVDVTVKSSGMAWIVEVLIFSVIEVGGCIFFIRNSKENAQLGCLFDGFQSSRYGTIVVARLLRDLFIGLWTLLFVIPGIIKSYEYRMIPYILADRPEVSRKEAFAISKEMMRGNKWRLFVFDLSFLGWYILNLFTFNLLNYLYINPYKNAATAELYLELRGDGYRTAMPQGNYDYEVIG